MKSGIAFITAAADCSQDSAGRAGAKEDLSDIYTIALNLAGLPGMSIPVGFSKNLPVGMQIIGNYFSESRLLNVAHQYQQVTDWHHKTPVGFCDSH